MMVTERIPHFMDPVCGLASGGLSFKQTPEGTLVIGVAISVIPTGTRRQPSQIPVRWQRARVWWPVFFRN